MRFLACSIANRGNKKSNELVPSFLKDRVIPYLGRIFFC
jgi:hypothetical protein